MCRLNVLFRAVLASAILAVTLVGFVTPASAAGTAGPRFEAQTMGDAHVDQAARLYRTILVREADAGGARYWGGLLADGYAVERIAQLMLQTPEYIARSSGDHILDAYNGALGRQPQSAGYEFWAQFANPTAVIIAISDSAEHQKLTDTEAPPERTPRAHSLGYEDAGNGVFVPPILLEIRWCESRDDYTAANTRSSARGGYQFLSGSWAAYGHAARYGVSQAHLATPAQQDEAALLTWQESGTRPWNASRHCWG